VKGQKERKGQRAGRANFAAICAAASARKYNSRFVLLWGKAGKVGCREERALLVFSCAGRPQTYIFGVYVRADRAILRSPRYKCENIHAALLFATQLLLFHRGVGKYNIFNDGATILFQKALNSL